MAAVWSLAEKGNVDGLVSAVSYTTVFYMMRRWSGREAAAKAVRLLRDSFGLAVCDSFVINRAIDSDLPDFEDAVQYFSALHAEADCIITRNAPDFPRRPALPVLSPAEFLAQFEAE